MLFILPVKFAVADWGEEIFVDVFLWPVFWVADDPVEFAGFKVEVDDGVFMTTGEGEAVGLFVVPNGVVVEPVFLGLAAGAWAVLWENGLVIPFLEDFAGVFVEKNADVFNGAGIEIEVRARMLPSSIWNWS